MHSAVAIAKASEFRGRRDIARYRTFFQEACRQLQAESFLERERAWAHTDYTTTYEELHGKPGFEPALERQLREGAALAELHPLDDSEPVLSVWYCRQRMGAAQGTARCAPLPMVTPAHAPASQPFRRTSAFTTPTHLSLHESPAEPRAEPRPPARARLDLLDRLQVQGWTAQPGPGVGGATVQRYPLADVFADAGKKYWCDRHEDPIRTGEGSEDIA